MTKKRPGNLPGPDPSVLTGNALSLMGEKPWEVCAEWGRTYGPVTLIWIFDSPALVLNGPVEIGEVLETRRDQFYKASPTEALRPIVTDACPFILNGADWQYKRANHPFSMPDLSAWMDTQVAPMRTALVAGLDAILARSEEGPVQLLPEMLRLAFDTFSVAVWGRTLGDEAYRWFNTLGDEGNFRMKSPVELPILSPSFHLQRPQWFDLYARLTEEAQAGKDSGRTDLVSVLVRRGSPLPAAQFQAALANIFYGGAYSVTSAVATTLYLMSKYPEEAARLRAAVDAARPLSERFDRRALEACAPLDHVLRESLRFYCPVPMYSRNTSKDRTVTLAGAELPADTSIYITNWFLHRDPARWDEPDRYRPGRWANGGVERDPIGSGWFFPFGRGPRECVGLPFALFYMKLALATIVAKTAVELDPEQAYELKMYFGVISPQDLVARFTPRAG